MLDITSIKVTGVSKRFKEQLQIMSENKGITLSKLGRIVLRSFYESQPENLKIKRDLDITSIKVTGVSKRFKEQLQIMSENKGITLSELGRIVLRSFYESQPENLKIKRDSF